MKKIITFKPQTKLAQAVGCNYFYFRKCLNFEVNSLKAVKIRYNLIASKQAKLITL